MQAHVRCGSLVTESADFAFRSISASPRKQTFAARLATSGIDSIVMAGLVLPRYPEVSGAQRSISSGIDSTFASPWWGEADFASLRASLFC